MSTVNGALKSCNVGAHLPLYLHGGCKTTAKLRNCNSTKYATSYIPEARKELGLVGSPVKPIHATFQRVYVGLVAHLAPSGPHLRSCVCPTGDDGRGTGERLPKRGVAPLQGAAAAAWRPLSSPRGVEQPH